MRSRWTKKNTADLDKELHYVLTLVKYPVVVGYPDGVSRRFFPPHRVEVSQNFFRSVKCQMCRKCCSIPFSKFWTEREYRALESMYTERVSGLPWEEMKVRLDGQPVTFMRLPASKDPTCPFLDRVKGCLIHAMNPIHCRVPLIKFKSKRGVTRITKEVYGRNWAMKCRVRFVSLTREEFQKWDLEVMGRVKGLALDLGLPTQIDWVIRELERLFPELVKHKNILSL